MRPLLRAVRAGNGPEAGRQDAPALPPLRRCASRTRDRARARQAPASV